MITLINFSEEGLLLAVTYLIPGFLITLMISSIFHLEKDRNSTVVFKFLFFSLINMMVYTVIDKIWFWICKTPITENSVFISFFRNIILPIIIAILLTVLLKKVDMSSKKFFHPLKNMLQHLGLDTISITSSSWDYVFSELKKSGGSYIIIQLKDGSYVYGIWSIKSFASSGKTNGDNDIFFEETYTDESFSKSNNSGVLINQSDILTINVDSTRIKPTNNIKEVTTNEREKNNP